MAISFSLYFRGSFSVLSTTPGCFIPPHLPHRGAACSAWGTRPAGPPRAGEPRLAPPPTCFPGALKGTGFPGGRGFYLAFSPGSKPLLLPAGFVSILTLPISKPISFFVTTGQKPSCFGAPAGALALRPIRRVEVIEIATIRLIDGIDSDVLSFSGFCQALFSMSEISH